MIFLPTENLTAGMVLADAIYADAGCLPLLMSGQVLSRLTIERLKLKRIPGAYIEADGYGDVKPVKLVTDESKARITGEISEIFTAVSRTTQFANSSFKSVTKMAQGIVAEILSNEEVMVNVLELKNYSDYTYSHSMSVAMISVVLGARLGLNRDALSDLATAGLLHDIGKMTVPKELLDKPSRLTDEEFEIIKTHPQNAYALLSGMPGISFHVLSGIKCHHERYDGTGYPDGLKGKDIPLFGRIIAVADVYDAITSNRPYSQGCFPREAIEYMMGCADTHFEMRILMAFLRSVVVYPTGTLVTLSTGKGAIVLKTFGENTLRPMVRLLEEDGGEDIDLLHDEKYRSVVVVGMGYGNDSADECSKPMMQADRAGHT